MNYVEFLRARNVVRFIAIVLGAMLVLSAIARIAVSGYFHNGQAVVERINREPGTVVTHSDVNGRQVTTMTNASRHERVTIEPQDGGGNVIRITEPAKHATSNDHVAVGSVTITTTTGPKTATTVIDTNGKTPFGIFLGFAYIMGLIVATVLGASFSRENEGHLEFALLKPVTRLRYGLGVIGIDLAAIVVCELLTIGIAVLAQMLFETPHFDFSGIHPAFIGVMFLLPFAWYAGLNAATTSLKRGAGAVVGFAWPVSAVIIAIGSVDIQGTPIGDVVHAVFWSIARLIPLSYGSFSSTGGQINAATGQSTTFNLLMAVLLLLAYGALTLVQWRRVEA